MYIPVYRQKSSQFQKRLVRNSDRLDQFILPPKMIISGIYFLIKHMLEMLKRNVSGRRFFYAPKHMFYRQLLKHFTNGHSYLNSVCPKFISNERVFRKIQVRIF